MHVPQTRQNTDKCIEQSLVNDRVPEHIHRPQVTEIKDSNLLRSLHETSAQTVRYKITK